MERMHRWHWRLVAAAVALTALLMAGGVAMATIPNSGSVIADQVSLNS